MKRKIVALLAALGLMLAFAPVVSAAVQKPGGGPGDN